MSISIVQPVVSSGTAARLVDLSEKFSELCRVFPHFSLIRLEQSARHGAQCKGSQCKREGGTSHEAQAIQLARCSGGPRAGGAVRLRRIGRTTRGNRRQ